jgi:uncharacterized protein (TIGR02679 family)
MSSGERLQRLLGGMQLADLRKRLRRHYELGGESAMLTLTRLSAAERCALESLLGIPPRFSGSMRIDIVVLDGVLQRAQLADSLRDALEILDGPITNRVAARTAMQEQWNEVSRACRAPQLAALLADTRGIGLLKRIARNDPQAGARLCELAERVLNRLPAAGVARSRLAAETLGDAHALDQGQAVATLVLAALRHQRAIDPDLEESTREIWADAGVLVNELARPALFLNLPVVGAGFVPGQPSYLSLRDLVRTSPRWDVSGVSIFVCENPNVIAIAADALGERCAPLVCTDGMPAAAQRALLGQLIAGGACLHYHGDFDWPGLNIGNCVTREFGAKPWRYRAQDYLAAAADIGDNWRPLGPAFIGADWDEGLSAAMMSCGHAIDEEAVVEVLLPDLSVV